MKLLSIGDANPKIGKSDKANKGYNSAILHLSPANESGLGVNLCPFATQGCRASCLFKQGRGRTQSVRLARFNRTNLFVNNFLEFKKQIKNEIYSFKDKNNKLGVKTAIRLNGTSDIVWEAKYPELFSDFSDVLFYDYTKIPKRISKNWKVPDNYYLIFSKSESNLNDCLAALENKVTVAVVFRDKLPDTWYGYQVVNGDSDDLIFLHPPGVVLGLLPKGSAKNDRSGFVVDT